MLRVNNGFCIIRKYMVCCCFQTCIVVWAAGAGMPVLEISPAAVLEAVKLYHRALHRHLLLHLFSALFLFDNKKFTNEFWMRMKWKMKMINKYYKMWQMS